MDDVYNNEYGFDIPVERIPSEEDTQRLFEGDESIVPILIEGMTAFIVREVDWFLRQTPGLSRYKEDLLSEALVALTDFINKSLGKRYSPSKILGYAKKDCLNAIKDWAMVNSVPVTVSKSTLFDKGLDVHCRELQEEDQLSEKDSLFSEIWFDDFMSGLDERDQTIIRMKIDGRSVAEIARKINLTGHHVAKRLGELLEMYGGFDD